MRFIKHSVLALLAAMVVGVSAPAAAQTTVLTINVSWLMEETSLGRNITEQLTQYDANIVGSMEEAGSAFQAEVEELQQQRDDFIITEEVFEQRVGELQLAERQLMARGEVGQQLRQFAVSYAPRVFYDTIEPDVVAEYNARGGEILILRQEAIMASDAIDISEAVRDRVEARITELEVDFRPPQVRAMQEASEE